MSAAVPALAISYTDIAAAAHRLHGVAHRTPVRTSRTADAMTGAQLFFKCENFQRMGAFKFRGAYNALAQFSPAQRQSGVIAFSSGNHAQAIALSARLLGMPSVLVMPLDSPAPSWRRRGATSKASRAARSCCTTATPKTAKPSAGVSPPSAA
jgi:threonine dehydratase